MAIAPDVLGVPVEDDRVVSYDSERAKRADVIGRVRLRWSGGASECLRRFPTSYVARELAYFAAVFRYRLSHEAPDLLDNWGHVQRRYPMSEGRTKQTFIENKK